MLIPKVLLKGPNSLSLTKHIIKSSEGTAQYGLFLKFRFRTLCILNIIIFVHFTETPFSRESSYDITDNDPNITSIKRNREWYNNFNRLDHALRHYHPHQKSKIFVEIYELRSIRGIHTVLFGPSNVRNPAI